MTEENSDPSADAPPILFPIQLVEVHCASVQAEHKPKPEDEPPVEAGVQLGVTPLDDERRGFRARLDVHINAPSPADGEIADLLVVVQGSFASESEISDELYKSYIDFTPIALLWPYARAYLAQTASMLGLIIPPLPSLDALSRSRSNSSEG